jgi:hypothetical protein
MRLAGCCQTKFRLTTDRTKARSFFPLQITFLSTVAYFISNLKAFSIAFKAVLTLLVVKAMSCLLKAMNFVAPSPSLLLV